jgi:hypothetical protein
MYLVAEEEEAKFSGDARRPHQTEGVFKIAPII